ncbi:unnamed protein product, partial [Rotaria sp. Silwood1]
HLFSVQFYPEYYAGSCDTENLFQILLYIFQSYKSTKPINAEKYLVEQLTKRVSDANAPPPAFCGDCLNCGQEGEIDYAGILQKYSSNILGTPIESIKITKDRSLFTQKMVDIGEKVAPYQVVKSLEQAVKSAEQLVCFPEDDRVSGFIENRDELISLLNSILPDLSKLLIDKSLKDWKKIEYEVVRDQYDNCIVICNMENIDPLALRTDYSIVVAPSQTLSSDEYNLLRSVSIIVIRHLGIIGTCNVQFALNSLSSEYYIMKVNVGLSHSSEFTSKATGYPLAYITAKLVLGLNLAELSNDITNTTCSCFDPSLDYVAIKVLRLNLSKSNQCSNEIETSMESAGEVMAIGRSFEEAFQQALRMVDKDITGFDPYSRTITDNELITPTDERVFLLATALYQGYTIEHIFELTKIDRWFLNKFESIIQFIIQCSHSSTVEDRTLLLEAQQLGFSHKQIAQYSHIDEDEVRASCEHYDN